MLRKPGLYARITFFFLLFGWMLGSAILMLLRFSGTGLRPDWMTEAWQMIPVWFIGSLIVSLFHFLSILIMDSPSFRRRSYSFSVIFQMFTVGAIIILTLLIGRLTSYLLGHLRLNEIVPSLINQLRNLSGTGGILFFAAWTTILTFVRQMMVKVGPRVLGNLFLGRYHFPREEQRIFLFLDLQSSTDIAARLGHQRYSRLIQECFYDLTDSILKHEVEVYQYIGDEAVLTWRVSKGLHRANCVRVYFDFIESLRRRADYYQQAYGVVPFFKCGLNIGPVTVAEIGVVKREIAYLSEVLNTAARIQGKCNELGQGILLSKPIKEQLTGQPGLSFQSMGRQALRGVPQEEELFAVSVDGEWIRYSNPEMGDQPLTGSP